LNGEHVQVNENGMGSQLTWILKLIVRTNHRVALPGIFAGKAFFSSDGLPGDGDGANRLGTPARFD
jgi:hypothetical protein